MTRVKMPPPQLYFFVQRVIGVLAWFIFKQRIFGRENIPKEGPFLLVCNHLSIFDIPFLFKIVPRQMVMFSADKWRTTPLIGLLCEMMGVIWVARGEADMDAIKLSLHHLKSGGAMGLAPEGTRSPSGQLQKGKTGAAYLADRSGVPILPAVVWGTEKVAQNLKRGRRTLVTCVIDKPFRLPSNGRAKGETLEQYTEIIMCRLAALLPPEYRGVYDNHPGLVGMPRPLSRRSGDL